MLSGQHTVVFHLNSDVRRLDSKSRYMSRLVRSSRRLVDVSTHLTLPNVQRVEGDANRVTQV